MKGICNDVAMTANKSSTYHDGGFCSVFADGITGEKKGAVEVRLSDIFIVANGHFVDARKNDVFGHLTAQA